MFRLTKKLMVTFSKTAQSKTSTNAHTVLILVPEQRFSSTGEINIDICVLYYFNVM